MMVEKLLLATIVTFLLYFFTQTGDNYSKQINLETDFSARSNTHASLF